jgi:hypothetical protein
MRKFVYVTMEMQPERVDYPLGAKFVTFVKTYHEGMRRWVVCFGGCKSIQHFWRLIG